MMPRTKVTNHFTLVTEGTVKSEGIFLITAFTACGQYSLHWLPSVTVVKKF
jgi:hypothetical protein